MLNVAAVSKAAVAFMMPWIIAHLVLVLWQDGHLQTHSEASLVFFNVSIICLTVNR